MMRTLMLHVLIIALMPFSGFGQKSDLNAMLENKETRNEIFTAITNDQNLMSAFRQYLRNDQGNMQMKDGHRCPECGEMHTHRGNKGRRSSRTRSHHGRRSMMGYSSATGSQMMQNRERTRTMMQNMRANGIISKKCMQASLKRMDSINAMRSPN